MVEPDLLKPHIVTRVTDEGLVIDIFVTLPGAPLFAPDRRDADPAAAIDLRRHDRPGQPSGHQQGRRRGARPGPAPFVHRDNPVWPLSEARADAMRALMMASGMDYPWGAFRPRDRASRIGNRPCATRMAPRNSRLEVILLRQYPTGR